MLMSIPANATHTCFECIESNVSYIIRKRPVVDMTGIAKCELIVQLKDQNGYMNFKE